jgi:hypothetical protein
VNSLERSLIETSNNVPGKFILLFIAYFIHAYYLKRIKGAIDQRIAEEQARAKAAAVGPGRASSTLRSTSSRSDSPSKRPRPRPKVVDDGAKGPDPSEFEGAFVIEDDSEEPSRVGTPAVPDTMSQTKVGDVTTTLTTGADSSGATEENNGDAGPKPLPVELPADVRAKLRKLDKLEPRYQGA